MCKTQYENGFWKSGQLELRSVRKSPESSAVVFHYTTIGTAVMGNNDFPRLNRMENIIQKPSYIYIYIYIYVYTYLQQYARASRVHAFCALFTGQSVDRVSGTDDSEASTREKGRRNFRLSSELLCEGRNYYGKYNMLYYR